MIKPVYGYEGRYEIDEVGNIWSVRREKQVNGRTYAWAGKKLSPFIDTNGYKYVNLGNGSTVKKLAIHKLVLLSFIGEPTEKIIACHFDGNKLNNSIENLRWGTVRDNYLDSVRHKTNSIGERSGVSKLKEVDVLDILKSTEPSTKLCKKYNVASSTIRAVRIKQNWKHI